MIKPSPGMAFVIEDTKDQVSDSGIILSPDAKLQGVSGIIYAINATVDCPTCKKSHKKSGLKEGARVVFSRFTAEQLDLNLKDIPEGRLRAVPVDSILATID